MKEWLARHRAQLGALSVVVMVFAMLFARLIRQPMPRYGGGAAQYIEHAYRIERVVLWRSRAWDHIGEFLVAADIPEGFPPMLHALSIAAGAVLGHSVEDLLITGPLWLALLAGSVGWVAKSLTGRTDVATAALLGCILMPAAQGMALRFYYDLPAAALLWMALAVFVWGQDRHPFIAGAIAGPLVWTAGCVKWSMLPYAALTFPFAVLARSVGARRWVRRGVALAVAAGVAGAMMWAWMEGGGGSHNETLASRSSSTGPWEERVRFLPLVVQAVAARGMYELTHPDLVKALWYPMAAVVSILSPLWTLALAPLVVTALRRRPRGILFPVGSIVGIGLFLTLMLAIRDERFTIAAAAAAVLLAALGWGELKAPWRGRAAVLVVATGLLVSADAHFAPKAFWNAEFTVYPGRQETPDDPGLPPLRARGLGVSASVEQRGWARSDGTPLSEFEFTEGLWRAIEECGGPSIELAAHVLPNGSTPWLQYRAVLSFVQGDGWTEPRADVLWAVPPDVVHDLSQDDGQDMPEDDGIVHHPAGDAAPTEPLSGRAHVGIAGLDGAGLRGEGWVLRSRHAHPESAEGGAPIAVFARPPARCLKGPE